MFISRVSELRIRFRQNYDRIFLLLQGVAGGQKRALDSKRFNWKGHAFSTRPLREHVIYERNSLL